MKFRWAYLLSIIILDFPKCFTLWFLKLCCCFWRMENLLTWHRYKICQNIIYSLSNTIWYACSSTIDCINRLSKTNYDRMIPALNIVNDHMLPCYIWQLFSFQALLLLPITAFFHMPQHYPSIFGHHNYDRNFCIAWLTYTGGFFFT